MAAPDSISAVQNQARAIDIAAAFGRRYDLAQRWRGLLICVTIALPVLGSILVFADSDLAVALGAISGTWSVLGRFGIGTIESRLRRDGARAQECFDCLLFHMTWNPAISGPKPAPEELHDWAGKRERDDRYDWYPDVSAAVWPMDVLVCQRASVVWGRRNHTHYAYIAAGLAIALFLITAVVGLLTDLTFSEYLVSLGLPALPAFLVAGDFYSQHQQQALLKSQLEEAAEEAWEQAITSEIPVSIDHCRELQDTIFESRAKGVPIPKWYYKLRLNRDEPAMREAARTKIEELPPALRSDAQTYGSQR